VDERLGQHPPVPDDPDIAGLLLDEEDPPVEREGNVRGEGEASGHLLERWLSRELRGGRRDEYERGQDEQRAAGHASESRRRILQAGRSPYPEGG